MDSQKRQTLELLALDIRRQIMRQLSSLGRGHIGGTLSLAELLAVLYGEVMNYRTDNPNWPERDHFVLSKGHAGPALYAALALNGFFPLEILDALNRPHTILPSHADRLKTPGVDVSTGSLGQGLSVALGIALGKRMKGMSSYVYAAVGDGECQEGQIWEAAMFGNQWKLSNIIAFVDNNKQQADNWTDSVCSIGDIRRRFEEFGWYAQEVNGHDVSEIYEAIMKAQSQKEKPNMIVLQTNKGQGLKKYQAKYGFHNGEVTQEEYEQFLKEFDESEKAIYAKGV